MEQPRIETLYEISLAIRQRESPADTARAAVSAYVEQLDCTLGAVLETTTGGESFDLVGIAPSNAETGIVETARQRLERQVDSASEGLPLCGQAGETTYQLFELPDYGVLLLAGDTLDESTALELDRLNEQLATTCGNARQAHRFRGERDRFEAIFDAIQEPILTTVYEQGDPIIRRVNDAFQRVFGVEESDVVGTNVNEIIVPDAETQRMEASGIDEQLTSGEEITREITREAADGMREFLLRAVPVGPGSPNEYVGIYVDITDNKVRRRRFEWLYTESRTILASTDTETICEHTIEASHELLDVSSAAVYLHDRAAEALVPTATTGSPTTAWEGYPDEQSIVWDVYRGGPRWFEDILNAELAVPGEIREGSALCVPLGDHGVLWLATDQRDNFEETDFQVGKLLAVVVEIALDRALREQGLEEVQAITRRILDADDHEQAARGVLEQLPAALDMPMSAIWRYDGGTDRLDPVATTDAALDLLDGMPSFSGEDSIAWRAFNDGETKLVADVSAHDEVYNQHTPFNSEIIMPLGEFGILATASTRRESFTEAERRLLETLAANVETAMRLVSRRHERDLLDQVVARVLRHNLRNDLNVIQGHAMALTDRPESSPHAEAIIEHCQTLQKTAQNARKMREIVNSSGETTTVSLPEAVDHALRRITEQFSDTEIAAEFEATPEVVAHPALPTVIEQLLENSIEHADRPAADVVVGITIFEADSGVVVEITDNGPGIPDEEIDILDQHGESALEHGSGAGLWMVDRVVEYSNATISFDTDDGTTVRLRFDPA